MDSSPPGFSVHGILQARILQWAAISFCRGSSQALNLYLLHCTQILYHLSHQGSPSATEIHLKKLIPSANKKILVCVWYVSI